MLAQGQSQMQTLQPLDFIRQVLIKCGLSTRMWRLVHFLFHHRVLEWKQKFKQTAVKSHDNKPKLTFFLKRNINITGRPSGDLHSHLQQPRMLQSTTSTPPRSKDHPSLLRPHTHTHTPHVLFTPVSRQHFPGCHGENPLPLQSPHPANTNILSYCWQDGGMQVWRNCSRILMGLSLAFNYTLPQNTHSFINEDDRKDVTLYCVALPLYSSTQRLN